MKIYLAANMILALNEKEEVGIAAPIKEEDVLLPTEQGLPNLTNSLLEQQEKEICSYSLAMR